MRVFSSMHGPPCPSGNSTQNELNRRLCGPQRRSGCLSLGVVTTQKNVAVTVTGNSYTVCVAVPKLQVRCTYVQLLTQLLSK
jgi:hypothetical protein